MINKKSILLVVGLVLIAGSLFAMNSYIGSKVHYVDVAVYTKDLSKNQILTTEDVENRTILGGPYVGMMEKDASSLIGKTLNTDVLAKSFVYSGQIIEPKERDVFSMLDLSMYRKISVPVDVVSTMGGTLFRGDTIDLSFIDRAESEDNGEFTYARVFMQNVLVYDVLTQKGERFIPTDALHAEFRNDLAIEEETSANEDGPAILILAVPLPQIEEIQARLESGIVTVVSRFAASDSYETLGYAIGGKGSVPASAMKIEEGPVTIIDNEQYRINPESVQDIDISDNEEPVIDEFNPPVINIDVSAKPVDEQPATEEPVDVEDPEDQEEPQKSLPARVLGTVIDFIWSGVTGLKNLVMMAVNAVVGFFGGLFS